MKNFIGSNSFKMKNACLTCKKSGTCKEISQEMKALRSLELPVWDTESINKLIYAKAELSHLGFAYPNGIKACQLSRLNYFELIDLLQYIYSIRQEDTA